MLALTRTVSQISPFLVLAALCPPTFADFSYISAERSTSAWALTNNEYSYSRPPDSISNTLGTFHAGTLAWSSGPDYYAEAQAWQHSSFAPSSIQITQSAKSIVNGFGGDGAWWQASAYSSANVSFTVTQSTHFWIIMNTPFWFGQSGGRVSISTADSVILSLTGVGAWEGTLDPGTYSLATEVYTSSATGTNAVDGGWLYAAIGVPTPATGSLLALTTLFASRRRRD